MKKLHGMYNKLTTLFTWLAHQLSIFTPAYFIRNIVGLDYDDWIEQQSVDRTANPIKWFWSGEQIHTRQDGQ